MQIQRRNFLKQATALAAGFWLLPKMGSAIQNNFQSIKINKDSTDLVMWRQVRQNFPLTHNRIYLNNATLGPMPYPVLGSVQQKLAEHAETGEYSGWEAARSALAEFVNASEQEISLTHNTTEGINIMAWGLPLRKGDEVIMTTHEHAGNALPWLNRMYRDGIVIKTFEPALSSAENLNRVNNLINKRTRVIAVPHITCTTGTVLPVKEISKLGREKNLFVLIDGAHAPGSTVLNLTDLGCHAYAACTHKWLCAPAGTGFLFVQKDFQKQLNPMFFGALGDVSWDLQKSPPAFGGYADSAHRYDYGTQSAALCTGVAEAVNFMGQIGMVQIENRTRNLSDYLQKLLLKMPDKVEMLSSQEAISRGPMVTFRPKNIDYKKFVVLALENKFRIRELPEAHLNAIRVSTHIYNNEEELNQFADFVRKYA